MGTYAVTHVKKDEKIIPLSDSYDGYFSGMGLSNIWAIKYMDDSLLEHLAKQYIIAPEDEEQTPTSREIDEAIFQFSQTTQTQEAIDWLKSALSQEIRTSVTGFGPLLLLNINPHYGRDFEYCDYLIDLDRKVYVINEYEIPFSTLRALSSEKINFLCEYQQNLIKNEKNETPGFEELLNENEQNNFKSQLDNFLNSLIKLDQKLIVEHFSEQQKQRDDYAENSVKNVDENTNKDVYINAYSVQTANDIPVPDLRLMLTLCQRLTKADPAAAILLKNAVWGVEENYASGGISFYSPREHDSVQHHYHDNVLNYLTYVMKYRFNMMSSGGVCWKYANEVSENEREDVDDFFKPPVIDKCLYNLVDIQEHENLIIALKEANIWMVYHADYESIRETLIQQDSLPSSPFVWLFTSLLHEDSEMFKLGFRESKKQWETLSNADKKRVAGVMLRSLDEGAKLGLAVQELVANHIPVVSKTAEFMNVIKTTDLLSILEPFMTGAEKARLLEKKKVKPSN